MTFNKLIVWGDSIAKGVTFNSVTNRLALLRDSGVRLMANLLGLDLINHAKLGCTLPAGLSIIKRDLEQQSCAETALIEFGGNDCDFRWDEVAADPTGAHQPNTPLPLFESSLCQLVQSVREHGVSPVLVTLPPIDDERYFSTISRGRDAENILQFLHSPRRIYTWHERYSLAVGRVAARLSCPLVELREAFLSTWDYRDYISDDGIHPNAKGQQLISEALTDFFSKEQAALA